MNIHRRFDYHNCNPKYQNHDFMQHAKPKKEKSRIIKALEYTLVVCVGGCVGWVIGTFI